MSDNGDGRPVGYDTIERKGHLHPTRRDGPMRGLNHSHVHSVGGVHKPGHTHETSAVGPLGPATYPAKGAFRG